MTTMNDPQLSESITHLSEQVAAGNRLLKKQLSMHRAFAHSIVQGAGYAIGAGVVASVIIAVLTKTLSSVFNFSL